MPGRFSSWYMNVMSSRLASPAAQSQAQDGGKNAVYAIHCGKAVIRIKLAYEAKFRQDLKTATDVEANRKTVQSAARHWNHLKTRILQRLLCAGCGEGANTRNCQLIRHPALAIST